METKINIAEILKDKPQGTKLYSRICGVVELKKNIDVRKKKSIVVKELKDLVVGDNVLVISRYYRRIAKVDKVTKTQIIANNARFRRDSGWQYGGDSWDRKSISVPTEKEISDVKEENLRNTLVYAISSFDFKRLSTDELKQVYNIVKGKENKRE